MGHSFRGVGGILSGATAPPAGEPLTIATSDYKAFVRLLGDIQAAYSTEDLCALVAAIGCSQPSSRRDVLDTKSPRRGSDKN
jgi:hypothetical protein